ncbi:MAG TPA: hypothetical protein VK399_01160, partial [Longimicrobiaceae bacterium]|nr:hypothetical protein [Longimicrobiaceae bacterium]
FSHDHFYFLAGHFHEAFHAYQSRRFNEAAGVKSGFGEPIATSPRAGTAEFAARAEIERRILAAALRTPSLDSLRPLLLGYLAVRHARSWGAPDVQQVERAMELDEGTAGLVGYEAALLATDQPRARIPEVVVERELGKPLAGMPEFPESDARLMRWRMYGTGAALGLLLERLGRRDWRARAEAGSYLDVMLAHAVGFRHVEHVPLDEQARRRFGYDAVLSGAEAGRGRGGGPPPPPVP